MLWAAKSEQNGQVREHDGGATHVIGLALHDDVPADMQALTGAWQHQHHMHALVTAPKIAIWQLGRYNEDASKCMKQVSCNHLIYLPVFTAELHTELVQYRLHALILHYGQDITAGHYRAVLFCEWASFLTDDGVAAVRVGPEQWCDIERKVYLVIYVRVDS